MGARKTAPDAAKILAALPERHQQTLLEWESVLGLEPGGWWRVLGPQATVVAAILTAPADMPRGDAIRAAAERLGLEDDGELATHPGDSISRQIRRWQAGGHLVRSRQDRAA